MDYTVFWILLGFIHHGRVNSATDLSIMSEEGSQVSITNEDCSADVVLENSGLNDVSITVKREPEVLITDAIAPSTGFTVIRMPSDKFSEDAAVVFYSEHQVVHFQVNYREILSGLQISTGLPDAYALTGSNLTITALVAYGESVTFTFVIESDDPEESYYSSSESTDGYTKTASVSYTLGNISGTTYTISVTAEAGTDVPQNASTKVTALLPLPPFKTILAPANLRRTDNRTLDVIPGEIVTHTLIFTENFSENETHTVKCWIVNREWAPSVIYPNFNDNPPTVTYTRAATSTTGTFNTNINCSTVVSYRIDSTVLIIRSLVDYCKASIKHSAVPFDDDMGIVYSAVLVWKEYTGQATAALTLVIDYGGQEIRSTLDTDNGVIRSYQLEYSVRGDYEVTVEFHDSITSGTTNIILNQTIGIIGVAFDPGFTLTLYEKERVSFSIWKNVQEELNLLVTYDDFIQESLGMDPMSYVTDLTKLYTHSGLYRLVVEATFIRMTEKYKTREFEVLANPNAQLVNELFEIKYRDENFPLPVRLSNIPSVAARSPVEDNQSYTFSFDWRLLEKRSETLGSHWHNVTIVQPNAINLVLQNFISSTGIYKMELDIFIAELNKSVYDYMYMDVKEESIVAVIKGGSLLTVPNGEMINLDGSLSYDPAIISSPRSNGNYNLTYEWKCFQLPTTDHINRYTASVTVSDDISYRSFPPCSSFTTKSSEVSTLLVNSSTSAFNSSAMFELTVKKGSRQAWATQGVRIVQNQQPTVKIICFWNCGQKVVKDDRLVLHVDVLCPSCAETEMQGAQYTWSVYVIDLSSGAQTVIPASEWPEEMDSEVTSEIFDSRGGWWMGGNAYKVTVDVGFARRPSGRGEMTLYTNLPPYGGSCGVIPIKGIAGHTQFRFTAMDWKDEGSRPQRDPVLDLNPVLTYIFRQKATIDTPFIYNGGEISTPLKKLVACGTPTGECDVIVHVTDPYNSITECVMKVTVTEFINLTLVATTDQVRQADAVISKLELQMIDTLKKQDPVNIAQDAAIFASILKSMSDPIETKEQFNVVNVQDLNSKDGLSGLLDVDTAREPLKDSLAEAGNKLILDTNQALNNAIRRNDVRDAGQVKVFTRSLTSSMQSGEKYTTGPTIGIAAGSVKNLSLILSQDLTSTRVVRDIDTALDTIMDFMDTVVEAVDIDASLLEPTPEQLGKDTGLTDREIEYASDLLARRRKFKQQSRLDEAPRIVKESREIWDNMFRVANNLKDSQGSFRITKENIKMALQKTNRKQILETIQAYGRGGDVLSFTLDDIDIEDQNEDVNFKVIKTKNIFCYGANSKYITSDIVVASTETQNHEKLPMKSPTIRHVIHENCETNENEKLEMISPKFIEGDAAQMFYHEFENSNPQAKVCLSIRPTNDVIVYRLYVKVGSEPNDLNYDYRVTIGKQYMEVCKELCIPANKLKEIGTAYIGLRPLIYTSGSDGRQKRSAPSWTNPLASPYMYGMTVIACYSWDDQAVDWIASKCEMHRSGSEVTCRCDTPNELIGGLYFQHVPNRIHFGTVFSKFDVNNQAAVLATLIGLYLLFILLALWAYYMDRRSILKWGVFPLQDNYAEDEYYYLITVHTGLRKGAGTTSNIGFSLYGDMGDTGARTMTDGIREGMPTGSVVHLVMAVTGDLGSLQYLRIWHDNSGAGSGASWYLDKIVIIDLQNGDSYQFFNQRWMRPEEASLDVIVRVSSIEEAKTFENNFFSTASKQVTDDHMWLSVFIRPERSRFNRLERVGCCLAFLLLSMIASAMFYQGAKDIDREQSKPDLRIGALRMSWQQMYYSLVAAVITSVPIFIIVVIFRRARFRVEENLVSSSSWCRRRSSETQQDAKCEAKDSMSVKTKKELFRPTTDFLENDSSLQQTDFESKPTTSQSSLESSPATSKTSLGSTLAPSQTNLENEVVESQISVENNLIVSETEQQKNEVSDYIEDKDDVEGTNGMKEVEVEIKDNDGKTAEKDSLESTNKSIPEQSTVLTSGIDSEDSANIVLNSCWARAPWMSKLEKEIHRLSKMLLIRPTGMQRLEGSWPFVTRFLAWATIIASVLVCSFFIVLYSMEWGKDVTEEWLSTFFLTFLQSLVVVDPTKVVLITFLFTLFVGNSQFVGMAEVNMKIVSEVNKEYGIQGKPTPPRKHKMYNAAFKAEELQEAILKRKVRVLVRHTLMELAVHGLLLILVGSLCYTTRTTQDYRMQETVHNSLIGSQYNGFKYVNSTKMYYEWLENVVTPWLFPKKNYKGESILSQDRYYTADWSLFRLGAPRLRQVRMPLKDCPTTKIESHPCVDLYSIENEVTTEYCFGWRLPLPCPAIDQLRVTAGSWYFHSAVDLWSIPISGHQSTYGGGGYLTNLDINAVVASAVLKEIKNSFWIDRQTRAVILEFTLFSPNTNRFIGVVLLAEFPPSGGIITNYAVHPFAPYPLRGALGQYISVCEITSILLAAVGFVYIIYELRTHRAAALCSFWFVVDLLVFVIATVAISMYSVRLSSLKSAMKKIRDDPTQFVDFKNVIMWDVGFTYCLGFLISLTSFRLLKLTGYSKRTMRVYEVLRLSLGVIPGFVASVWIMLSSFAMAGYVLFHATSPFYKNYLESFFTLFLGVLGKTGFKNTGLPPGGFHITFFYTILFGCIVNIFLANWFFAVLLEILTVSAQRDCPAVHNENAKVFQLLWDSFVYLFSKKHPPIETLREHNKIHDNEKMTKVEEEFNEWILRLNLKKNTAESMEYISSVALYNKASKSSGNFKRSGQKIKQLSSIVNVIGTSKNGNDHDHIVDVSAQDTKEKCLTGDGRLNEIGKRANTLIDSMFGLVQMSSGKRCSSVS